MTRGNPALAADAAETQEYRLSAARFALALFSLVAIWIDPTEPVRYAGLTYVLLIFYTVCSGAILLIAWRTPLAARYRSYLHGFDILWTGTISLFTDGPNSPFFLFFVFALLAAAYRWAMPQMMLTVASVVSIYAAQAAVLWFHLAHGITGDFEINRFIMRAAYTVILGVLLGYIAEAQSQKRRHEEAILRVLAELHGQHRGLRETVEGISAALLAVFEAPACRIVIRDRYGRAFCWHKTATPDAPMRTWESSVSDYPAAPASLAAVRHDTSDQWACIGENLDGYKIPRSLVEDSPARRLLIVPGRLQDEFDGEIYLIDPHHPRAGSQLKLLEAIMERVGPALYNVYLIRRLRSRATAIERTRVARELHDGPLQSLLALDVRLDVLRRLAHNGLPSLEIEALQQVVREQAVALREVMQELKPPPGDSRQVGDWIANLCYRFQNESGIEVHCVLDLDEKPIPPGTCAELVRIVQEALVNVRKHSHAAHVVVRLASHDQRLRLSIDDDGRGFPFHGRMTHDDLFQSRKGPIMIKERVVAVGGELAIESSDKGARLEITVGPRAAGARA
jgi:signal transduction histidine kinase